MPESGSDPETAALHVSLTANQGSRNNIGLNIYHVTSAAPIVLTRIEYERVSTSNVSNEFIVLSNEDPAKNGADAAAPSATSNMPVSNTGSKDDGDMKSEAESILPTPKITLFPPEDVQLGWRGTHCVGAGMINVGNTCYLNSTLQALFHVPAFINWLHNDNKHLINCTAANGTMNGECIICAMNKTLKASQSKSGSVIKPFLIYNRLKFICKHLVHGQQEDAHEFMRYLLESMEEAYLTCYKDEYLLDSYSKETTPLNQIFGGYIRTEVTCSRCGGVSTTFQHCQDLLLDIQRASTLDDALAAYFCKERLDGDDAYHCERCDKKVSATKKFSVEKPPQVLCIQLKRFNILRGKINKHVSFSQRLDMTRFLCPQSAHRGPVPLTYHLVSMVTHVGSSVQCGHYTAVAQTSKGHYYQFDDSIVRPVSLSAVLDTNAYILMYEREPHMQPKATSLSQQSVPSATATTLVCAVNGQKPSMTVRGQTVQGPATILVNHKTGPVVNDKPSSANMVNHKQGCDSNSTGYTGASSVSSVKDRYHVVFGSDQPAVSSALPRLVMRIKNGKVYRSPPQPSPQQQEPSASTAASSAASLVPYCESGEDELSSRDSEAAGPPCMWDMPSLHEVSPFSPHSKPLLGSSKVPTKTNLKMNFSSSKGIPASGEAVPSLASSSSHSTNNVASSTTDWAVSYVKQKYNHTSTRSKKLVAHKSFCSDNDVHTEVTVNSLPHNKVKCLKDEPRVNRNTLWNSYVEFTVPKSPHTEHEQHRGSGDSIKVKSVHVKKRKHCDDVSRDVEECNSKQYSKKQDKKLKKSKEHKKKEKSAADDSERSKSVKSDGDRSYEWVKKTLETLRMNSGCRAQTNGHRWNGAYKSDVTNHLSHLSHQGYGLANVTNWSGKHSHMDEEVERDCRKNRKRNYENAYNEEFDRGRVKKMKYHHIDSHHNKQKYNPFQEYHNYKHQWRNSNGGDYYPYYHKGYKHYHHHHNHHRHHHQKQYAGQNNGFHSRNKYRNHYTKRDQ